MVTQGFLLDRRGLDDEARASVDVRSVQLPRRAGANAAQASNNGDSTHSQIPHLRPTHCSTRRFRCLSAGRERREIERVTACYHEITNVKSLSDTGPKTPERAEARLTSAAVARGRAICEKIAAFRKSSQEIDSARAWTRVHRAPQAQRSEAPVVCFRR